MREFRELTTDGLSELESYEKRLSTLEKRNTRRDFNFNREEKYDRRSTRTEESTAIGSI